MIIEIVFYNYSVQEKQKIIIWFYNGKQYFQVFVDDIFYFWVDYIYVKIVLVGEDEVV